MEQTIYILKDYGKIEIHLKHILDAKKISRGKLSSMTAMSYDLVNRYYNGKVTRVDLDVISRFCYALDCNVDDILFYKKD